MRRAAFAIRPLEARDVSALLTLERALADDGAGMVNHPGDVPVDEPAMRRALRPWLGRPRDGAYLVAASTASGTVPLLGSGELRRLAPARVRHVGVLALGVHPEHRRRGVGRALLAALLDRAARAQLLRVELQVRADNAPAIALYTQAGFQIEGRRRAFVREDDGRLIDDLLMARLADAG